MYNTRPCQILVKIRPVEANFHVNGRTERHEKGKWLSSILTRLKKETSPKVDHMLRNTGFFLHTQLHLGYD